MFFEVVYQFEVHGHVLVVVEGEGADEMIEILDEVAEDWDFVFFCYQVDRFRQQFFLYLVVHHTLIQQRKAKYTKIYNLTLVEMD